MGKISVAINDRFVRTTKPEHRADPAGADRGPSLTVGLFTVAALILVLLAAAACGYELQAMMPPTG